MITEDEKRFIAWWEQNRQNKKKALWQIATGLPLGVFLAVAIFLNFFSTWYRRASMEVNVNSSGVLVVLIGLVLIVVFVVVFSAYHRWEMNEQRYQELINKK